MLLQKPSERSNFVHTFAVVKVHDIVWIFDPTISTRLIFRRAEHSLQPEQPPSNRGQIRLFIIAIVLSVILRLARAAIRLIIVRPPVLLSELG